MDARFGADVSDPLLRALAHTHGGPVVEALVAPLQSAEVAPPAAALAQLAGVERLLRRMSWGGDKTRGVARLEFGAGALAGSTLVIEANHGTLSLVLELSAGGGDEGWVERLGARLRGRGLDVDELVVR